MAPQPLNKEYAEIKAGVSGGVDTNELPEAPDAPPSNEVITEPPATYIQQEAPETEPMQPQSESLPPEQYYGGGSAAPQATIDVDKIHEIAEAIVNERWEEFLGRTGDLAVWKERTETNILSIKQEIVRINQRFDNLQNAVLGRIKDYDQDMKDVHTEMKALEKVFERILEPLVSNIKELGRITQELKRK